MRLYVDACINWEFPLTDQRGNEIDLTEFDHIEIRYATGSHGNWTPVHTVEPTDVQPGVVYFHSGPGFLSSTGRWSVQVWLRSGGEHWTPTPQYEFLALQGIAATV